MRQHVSHPACRATATAETREKSKRTNWLNPRPERRQRLRRSCMEKPEFRRWLEHCPIEPYKFRVFASDTVDSYVSHVAQVEKHYDKLEVLYVTDHFAGFLEDPSKLPVKASGFANYAIAIEHCRDFLDHRMRERLSSLDSSGARAARSCRARASRRCRPPSSALQSQSGAGRSSECRRPAPAPAAPWYAPAPGARTPPCSKTAPCSAPS